MDADSIKTLMNSTGKVIETVPEIYNDGLQPAVKETGKTLSLLPRAINAALAPLEKWMLHREYMITETKALLQKKLQNVDPEKIVSPEPYVAAPTLQALSYCMDCEELRDMFANLLSKAMNTDTKDFVHPSFSEIIKQLSPLDANILKFFAIKKTYPIAKFRMFRPNTKISRGKFSMIFLEYPDTNHIDDLDRIATSLYNLERLGLVAFNLTTSLANKELYNKFYEHNVFKQLQTSVGKPPYEEYSTVDIKKGSVHVTALGRNFIKICVKPLE